jgi:hypothetical protein
MNRWDSERPPPEAYSRFIDPERFRPLHNVARDTVSIASWRLAILRVLASGWFLEARRLHLPTSPLRRSLDSGSELAFAGQTPFPRVAVMPALKRRIMRPPV